MDWSESSGSSGWAWTAVGLIYKLCVWLLLCKKNKKEKWPARAAPVGAPMPKSIYFLDKR